MNVPARRQQPSVWKAVIVVIIVIALLSAGLWYWRLAKQAAAGGWSGAATIDVVAIKVQPQTAPVVLDALGEIRAVSQVNLSVEAAGRVHSMQLEPGTAVKTGQLLLQLDDSTEQADLAAAEATARFSAYQLAQATELSAINAIANEVLQQRRAEHDQAKARIAQLKARIRQKHIIAPFDGELGLRHFDLGQYVNAGEVAATLTNLNQLYVNFSVPQQELARVKTGQPIRITSDIPGSTAVAATISAIEPQINRSTRNAIVQASFDNSSRALQPGMYVTVQVSLPAQSAALVLPASAIMTSSAGDTVVVVRELNTDNTGKGDIVPVKVNRRVGDQVVIAQGIQPGDTVLTEGQLRVQPGATLRVVDTATAASSRGGE